MRPPLTAPAQPATTAPARPCPAPLPRPTPLPTSGTYFPDEDCVLPQTTGDGPQSPAGHRSPRRTCTSPIPTAPPAHRYTLRSQRHTHRRQPDAIASPTRSRRAHRPRPFDQDSEDQRPPRAPQRSPPAVRHHRFHILGALRSSRPVPLEKTRCMSPSQPPTVALLRSARSRRTFDRPSSTRAAASTSSHHAILICYDSCRAPTCAQSRADDAGSSGSWCLWRERSPPNSSCPPPPACLTHLPP